jgi:hypothetical protein
VILFPCRGFSSLTKLHNAIVRFQSYIEKGKKGIRIVYAGDLDPSGWSIYENIVKRLDEMNKTGLDIVVDRFALLKDQVFGLLQPTLQGERFTPGGLPKEIPASSRGLRARRNASP